MKIKLYKRNKKIFYFSNLLISILISVNLLLIVNANDDINSRQLIIDSPKEINEGHNFSISVYAMVNNTPHYLINLQIFLNNKTYNITYDEPEITIKAPQVNEDTYIKIEAEKTGYINDEKYIMIINNEIENKSNLIITILDDDYIVEGNQDFTVLITNEEGKPISNTIVGIQNYIAKNSITYSDENGRAKLFAPNNRNEIIILAQKPGYINTSEKVWININPNLIEKIIQNPYSMIIVSIILLIISILIVNARKKTTNIKELANNKNYPIINQKNYKKSITNNKNSKNQINTNKIKESKIEEIRIKKRENNQKIITIGNKNDRIDKSSKLRLSKINDNWCEGKDDLRYKIDKLTENYDNFKENKWFEGKITIRDKIDEKLKKTNK